jgi:hypothetical protein
MDMGLECRDNTQRLANVSPDTGDHDKDVVFGFGAIVMSPFPKVLEP